MKKTTIDASLLPNVWLTWETTKGTFYLDCTTGKKKIEKPEFVGRYNPDNILINSGSKPRYGYAKYHADIEMLELAEVTITTTRKEEAKEWKYSGEKYFLKKDKTVLDENGKEKTDGFVLSHYHRANKFKDFLGMFYRIGYYKNAEEFKKFLGSDTYTVGSGRVVEVRYAWHIQEWYKTKQKVRGPGKQQKLTDKLTEMQVSDASGLGEKYKPIKAENKYGYLSGVNAIIYFERLNDGWSVLRAFDRNGNNVLTEIERMYLHDDGANRIVSPSKDGWIPSRQVHRYLRFRFVNPEEAMEKCNRLKYIIPLLDLNEHHRIKNHLTTILRFPEIEQMINMGYAQTAKCILNSDTPKAELRNMFGNYYNDKETSLIRKSGLTKYQFNKFMCKYHSAGYSSARLSAALKEMRIFFGDNFIHLDNAHFDKYYESFYKMLCGWQYKLYPQLEDIDIDKEKFIRNIVRLGEKNDTVYGVVNDTINRYLSLRHGTQPEINWYFDSYSDVVRAHDAIDALKRAQDEERRALWDLQAAERRKKEEEKRAKIDEERKQYEYEDDTYVIRLPKDLNEIVSEGSKQRICIGGYTSSHALGHTNLFFLRRKSEPDAPFYAIEMDNGKHIVQIHGFGNSWLGNHPEAIPTVVRWLRKNGIKCSEKILTCKAKGYGAINDYVPMPVVD